MSVSLRDYQTDIVNNVRAALKRTRKVLLQAPTGAGKTAMATYVASNAQDKGQRVWFIVHRQELILQTSLTFNKFDVKHSFIASSETTDDSATVFICGIDTVKRRIAKMAPEQLPTLVIWDECHHVGAAGWTDVMNQLGEAWHIGLSATPQRLDGAGLDTHFGELVPGPQTQWLIDHGHLSPYRIYAPSKPDLEGVHTLGGDFKANELANAMKPSLTGDAVQHWLKLAKGRPRTVTFAITRKHSESIVAAFNEAGIPSAHLDGDTPKELRAETIQRFARGELINLVNVGLMGEGFDLSAIAGTDVTVDCVVLLRPTQSLSLYLQMVGRALRPAPGKTAIILDHAGNAHRHGLPSDARTWTLQGRDKKARGQGEGPPPPATCPECFGQIARPCPDMCPMCGGFIPKASRELPKTKAEELVELKATKAAAKAAKAEEKERLQKEAEALAVLRKREERACSTLQELIALGKKREYEHPRAWANKKWELRQKYRA